MDDLDQVAVGKRNLLAGRGFYASMPDAPGSRRRWTMSAIATNWKTLLALFVLGLALLFASSLVAVRLCAVTREVGYDAF
jgi:hypothetical protein